jgi:hypothetical protein
MAGAFVWSVIHTIHPSDAAANVVASLAQSAALRAA